jgi:hypothetical protein
MSGLCPAASHAPGTKWSPQGSKGTPYRVSYMPQCLFPTMGGLPERNGSHYPAPPSLQGTQPF